MDEDRPHSQFFVRVVIRVLQFVLGLTVCGLYAVGARAGSARCAYAVTVGTLSVLTVIGSEIIGYCTGCSNLLFIWEAILV
jgi:hypothetical protein